MANFLRKLGQGIGGALETTGAALYEENRKARLAEIKTKAATTAAGTLATAKTTAAEKLAGAKVAEGERETEADITASALTAEAKVTAATALAASKKEQAKTAGKPTVRTMSIQTESGEKRGIIINTDAEGTNTYSEYDPATQSVVPIDLGSEEDAKRLSELRTYDSNIDEARITAKKLLRDAEKVAEEGYKIWKDVDFKSQGFKSRDQLEEAVAEELAKGGPGARSKAMNLIYGNPEDQEKARPTADKIPGDTGISAPEKAAKTSRDATGRLDRIVGEQTAKSGTSAKDVYEAILANPAFKSMHALAKSRLEVME